MDSPIRKMQKLKDYLRHKLFRKMKRQRKARVEQEQKIAEKELKRKLRRPKFDKGDDNPYSYVGNLSELWNLYNPETGGFGSGDWPVAMDEVVVTAPRVSVKDLNAHLRLGQYMQNAPAADIDKVMLGTLALGTAPITMLAAAPGFLASSDAVGGSAVGQAVNKVLTNPYFTSATEAMFAGHGLNHVVNEGVNGWGDAAITALEVAPLVRLAKPLWNISRNASNIIPELDSAYKEAVESGNRPEALRLLEQAYLKSGVPQTDVTVTPDGHAVGWYHGSEWGNHTIFDSSAMNATVGGASAHGKVKGNFLTTDVPSAVRYAGSSRFSSANIPEYTSPQTFSEKIKNLFGVYKPRRLYPAERIVDYAPKPERMFDTEGRPAIEHLDKVDNVVYPLYVHPGEDIMRLDFQGKPWSQSPVKFPNNFYLKRFVRDDAARTYKDEIVPYKDYEAAYKAWIEDPINIKHGSTSLDKMYFDDGVRSIEGFNSRPRYETVRLVEELVPNTTNGAVQTAAKEGKTSVLMRNVIDSNGGPGGKHYVIDDFVTLKPWQQKLADITYDDNGNLIPLSQRFNWRKNDIRYGWLPWLLGGTSATALYGAPNTNSDHHNSGKDIHIKPSKRGTFTAAAKKHGMGVQAYARKVLKAPKGKYSSAMRKKANFVRNAAKFKH